MMHLSVSLYLLCGAHGGALQPGDPWSSFWKTVPFQPEGPALSVGTLLAGHRTSGTGPRSDLPQLLLILGLFAFCFIFQTVLLSVLFYSYSQPFSR